MEWPENVARMERSPLLYISFGAIGFAQSVRANVSFSFHIATQLPTKSFGRQSLILKARVRSYASLCEICDGKADLGQVLLPVLTSSFAFINSQSSDFTCPSSITEVMSATESILPPLDLYTVNIAFCVTT